ncbi:glycoside hydrolase family 97 protein [Halopelagius longus]|uniref:Glycoside hydrolase family 97 protein n=1 Tax=Halopelagius longus TaxID=1236180 RepID=A0A1H1FRA3_9EURY|nr:glycoside hydrolase family 97 protein [Halopelagius longus]RDI70201.1 glycoside hydrolase family 97 protein [Halopelagius longus]SDR03441.1 Glycosyl-hydrolase 97 C-terminal, oligomerisation [Halopelagius longus]
MKTISHDSGDLEVGIDFSEPSSALRAFDGGTKVIDPSPIGIDTPDGPFPEAYDLVGRNTRTVEETIETARGKATTRRRRWTLATYTFESENGHAVDFEVCVTDDGIAYRYRIDGDGGMLLHGGEQNGPQERSGFRFPAGAVSWLFEYDHDHESVGKHYSASLADGEFTPPGLFRVNGSWVLVGEAGVDGGYAASRLTTSEHDRGYEFRTPDTTLRLAFPAATPWRVAVIGDLSAIAESTLIPDLVDGPDTNGGNAPVAVDADDDWVETGRVAWSWWGENRSPSDFERQKEHVNYAAERGWEYVLVDEGWDEEWVPDLVEYATEREVGIFLWAHWTELHRDDDRERRLDRWSDWGIAGVKVDFMDADDQGRHQFYDRFMEATAERELLVNFHGSIVPTGLSRRWPHVLTYEGVKGAEHHQWTGLPPEHNTILPFTRNVVGPMDYTPVTFSAENRLTSVGHELALSVIFESGLQHLADDIEEYAARPAAEWFLERVPAAWDETVLLRGRPGSEAVLARRRGGDWFVGAITAGPARTVEIPLTFLDAAREAQVVHEGTDGGSLVRDRRRLEPGETLGINVADNGGFCLYAPE